jgi:hypothetical protein
VWIGIPQGGTKIATLGAGQVVGELEVMIRSPRVASLAAAEETRLLAMPAAKLNHMLEQNDPAATKLVLIIARTLARRLAAVNQRVVKGAPLPPAGRAAAPPPVPAKRTTATPVAKPARSPAPAARPMPASSADRIRIGEDDLGACREKGKDRRRLRKRRRRRFGLRQSCVV